MKVSYSNEYGPLKIKKIDEQTRTMHSLFQMLYPWKTSEKEWTSCVALLYLKLHLFMLMKVGKLQQPTQAQRQQMEYVKVGSVIAITERNFNWIRNAALESHLQHDLRWLIGTNFIVVINVCNMNAFWDFVIIVVVVDAVTAAYFLRRSEDFVKFH